MSPPETTRAHTKTFDWSTIRRALAIITERKLGIKRDLLNLLINARIVNHEQEAQELIEKLELLGYISTGISKRYRQETWKATRRAYKEIMPYWLFFLKSLMSKL